MLHKMGYEACPECGRPCKEEDIAPCGEHCIGCQGDPERPVARAGLSDGSKLENAVLLIV